MTKKGYEMFALKGKAGVVLMRDGSPFLYTNRDMAKIGKYVLGKERGEALTIVSA